jgi:2-polyprenyl-3-methyl-5-hydroxy-6-metoxy-1,4-benzoquinol methylase
VLRIAPDKVRRRAERIDREQVLAVEPRREHARGEPLPSAAESASTGAFGGLVNRGWRTRVRKFRLVSLREPSVSWVAREDSPMNAEVPADLDRYYFAELAAAFVRGSLPSSPGLSKTELIVLGLQAGLRLHRFKRTADLPRVRRVLGVLRTLAPANLLDIGSGRGVFLWPLLYAFSELPVCAVDRQHHRIAAIDAVRRGGISRLRPGVMDATRLGLADKSVDVVTFLEVLEHLPQPERAAAEAIRVSRRFVVISVPSKEDDNPEHIRLFSKASLEKLLLTAGAQRVSFDSVLNHLIAVARV